jgi:hypothetical protein
LQHSFCCKSMHFGQVPKKPFPKYQKAVPISPRIVKVSPQVVMSSFISTDHIYLILLVCFNIFSTFALFSQPYISLNLAFLAFSSVRQTINNTVLGCRAHSLQCGRESLISIFFKTLRVKPFRKVIVHMSNNTLKQLPSHIDCLFWVFVRICQST